MSYYNSILILIIAEILPKSLDIPYMSVHQKIQLVKQLMTNDHISYTDLLSLAIPEIHYEDDCPSECRQKEQCNRTKKCINVAKIIVAQLKTKVRFDIITNYTIIKDKRFVIFLTLQRPVWKLIDDQCPFVVGSLR